MSFQAEVEPDNDNYDIRIDIENVQSNVEKLNVMQRCMYDMIMNNMNKVQHANPTQ